MFDFIVLTEFQEEDIYIESCSTVILVSLFIWRLYKVPVLFIL